MVRLELTLNIYKNKTPNRVTSVKNPGHKVPGLFIRIYCCKLRYNISYLTSTYSTTTFANCETKTDT